MNVLVLQGWLGRTPLLPCRYFVHSLASKVGSQAAAPRTRDADVTKGRTN